MKGIGISHVLTKNNNWERTPCNEKCSKRQKKKKKKKWTDLVFKIKRKCQSKYGKTSIHHKHEHAQKDQRNISCIKGTNCLKIDM